MEERQIGSLTVSVIGLGCNNFARRISQDEASRVVAAALERGVNFFDVADRYGYGDLPYSGEGMAEVFLGRALRRDRESVVIATKFGNRMSGQPLSERGGSAEWVVKACEDSLRRLGTDYIDLYQMHSPDPKTPIEETLEALHGLVDQGKVREVGCSNFSSAELEDAFTASDSKQLAKFSSTSNEYSLLSRGVETDLLPLCESIGVAFIPYFPLASGLLTGKYTENYDVPENSRLAQWTPRPHFELTEQTLEHVRRLSDFAQARGRTILELAISWLVVQPQVACVITGATRPDQIVSNIDSSGWRLTVDELDELDRISSDAKE